MSYLQTFVKKKTILRNQNSSPTGRVMKFSKGYASLLQHGRGSPKNATCASFFEKPAWRAHAKVNSNADGKMKQKKPIEESPVRYIQRPCREFQTTDFLEPGLNRKALTEAQRKASSVGTSPSESHANLNIPAQSFIKLKDLELTPDPLPQPKRDSQPKMRKAKRHNSSPRNSISQTDLDMPVKQRKNSVDAPKGGRYQWAIETRPKLITGPLGQQRESFDETNPFDESNPLDILELNSNKQKEVEKKQKQVENKQKEIERQQKELERKKKEIEKQQKEAMVKHQKQLEGLMNEMKGCITLKPRDKNSRPTCVALIEGNKSFVYDISYND